MRCPRCAAENPGRAKFCNECGLRLTPGEISTKAERRQITCLCCDLVNSVELSSRLDPEELRDTLAAYRRVCATVVRRFEGYVHDYAGDGLMVYFGYPVAHEDDAQRAVRSALGIIEAVSQLNSRLPADRRADLHVRIGIDTGLVVAGAVAAEGGVEGDAAIGVTPNIAARLQSLAAPDSVVISAATYRLIAGYFDCRELGFHAIRGISQPMAIHQVLHDNGARTRLDAAGQQGLIPMEGRDAELGRLAEQWGQARSGHGSVALLSGEAGIGKSRLIWALQQHAAQSPDTFVIRLSCSPYYVNTAFQPVVQLLERVLELTPDDPVEHRRLDKLDGLLTQYGFNLPTVVPLLAELLAVPFEDRYPPLEMPADRKRQMTIDALVTIAVARAARQPVLMVVEDLQWMDPSTLDVLTQLVDRVARRRQLVVLSCRPEFEPPWQESAGITRLGLRRLDRDAGERIVTEVVGGPVPDELLRQVLEKADGVPLYLEELTKLVVEQGLHRHDPERGNQDRPPTGPLIPATLADSLTARLDRLADAKGVAQLGASIGRQIPHDLLVAVSAAVADLDESALTHNLARLIDAGLLFVGRDQRGTVYTFKHALVQDAAYASLLRPTRLRYHDRIAQVLTEHFPAIVETTPELLAHHYTQAGLATDAVPHWLRAGERALRALANPEAIAHLTTGLDLLAGLPAGGERAAQELRFRLTLGPAYMAIRGYAAPEVEACYGQARALCRELGDTPQLVPVLHGLWTYHVVRSQHASALALGRQVLELGAATGDDALLVQGNMEVGWSHFFMGELEPARQHLERVLSLYVHERHNAHAFVYGDNPDTSARSCLAQVMWLLGHVDASLRLNDRNLEIFRSVMKHPYSVAFGLDMAAFLQQYRDDVPAARALVDEALELSHAESLALISAMASVLKGWLVAREGDLAEGVARMRRGLAAQLATGAELVRPYWLYLIAESCLWGADAPAGLALLDEAEASIERSGERYWESAVHHLRGRLLLSDSGASDSAEASFHRAIDVAHRQGARSLELRAALSLARLWQAEGRLAEAHELVAPIHDLFVEGLDTPDLRESAALLAELGHALPHQPDLTRLSGGAP